MEAQTTTQLDQQLRAVLPDLDGMPSWALGALLLADVPSQQVWAMFSQVQAGYGPCLTLEGYDRLVGLLSLLLVQELPDVRCAMIQSG